MALPHPSHSDQKQALSSELPTVRGEVVFWTGLGFIVLCLALLLFTVAAVFFFSVHKKEVVIVPQVTGEPLINALIELQEKHLVPKVLLKISNNSGDAGTILYQTPASGAKVIIDREVLLTVSKGNLVDKVPNYVGQKILHHPKRCQSSKIYFQQPAHRPGSLCLPARCAHWQCLGPKTEGWQLSDFVLSVRALGQRRERSVEWGELQSRDRA